MVRAIRFDSRPLAGCMDESSEQRVGPVGARQKFRMELRTDHEGVAIDFDNFNQFTIRRNSRQDHSVFLEDLAIFVVEFEAVAMTLLDVWQAIGAGSDCARLKGAGI